MLPVAFVLFRQDFFEPRCLLLGYPLIRGLRIVADDRNYRRRVKQADELNEFAIAESLRGILVQEQDHLIALATALGIDPPDPGIAD